MRTQSRRLPTRSRFGAFAIALGTAAIVLFGAGDPATAAGATGTVDTHHTVDGTTVRIGGKRLSTSLIPINFRTGGSVLTYCIDFTTPAKHGAGMVEDDWKNYPNPSTSFKADPAKVNWILHNSYPHTSLADLRGASGVERFSAEHAIAGTQLAIWHFSNDTRPDRNNDDRVLALYEYLTGDANVGLTAEPAPSLRFAPDTATGKAGALLGPLTLETTAKSVRLRFRADDDVQLVGKDGAKVTEAGNGDQLFVTVPAGKPAGQATVEAEVTATVHTGRLFRGDGVTTQTLITANGSGLRATGTATVTWTAAAPPQPEPPTTPPAPPTTPTTEPPSTQPPTTEPPATTPAAPTPGTGEGDGGGGLPVTGFQTGLIAAIGVALLGGGVALFLLARRRRTA
jgi:TQXA domain-containing protein/LPXTG-motif cell wall-anchored protein